MSAATKPKERTGLTIWVSTYKKLERIAQATGLSLVKQIDRIVTDACRANDIDPDSLKPIESKPRK